MKAEIFPEKIDIVRLLDQEKIEKLQGENRTLLTQNLELRASIRKQEQDSRELFSYFQRQADSKDEIIARLRQESARVEANMTNQLRLDRESHTKEIIELSEKYRSIESDLQLQVQTLERELIKVENFRKNRADFEQQILQLSETIRIQEQDFQDQLDAMERKFLVEKSALLKDLEDKRSSLVQESREIAQKNLSDDIKKIFLENRRLREEVAFHSKEAVDLQHVNEKVHCDLKQLRLEASVSSMNEGELVKQGVKRKKQVSSLKSTVGIMKKAMSDLSETSTRERTHLRQTLRLELQNTIDDASALRCVLKKRTDELEKMRKIARTILEQRNEIEQFFLDALAEVKQKIAEEKYLKSKRYFHDREAKHDETILPPLSRQFDTINVDMVAQASRKDSGKVYLADLTWEEKEKVLRLLFARINNVTTSWSSTAAVMAADVNNRAEADDDDGEDESVQSEDAETRTHDSFMEFSEDFKGQEGV